MDSILRIKRGVSILALLVFINGCANAVHPGSCLTNGKDSLECSIATELEKQRKLEEAENDTTAKQFVRLILRALLFQGYHSLIVTTNR
jgi:hypothetical protein